MALPALIPMAMGLGGSALVRMILARVLPWATRGVVGGVLGSTVGKEALTKAGTFLPAFMKGMTNAKAIGAGLTGAGMFAGDIAGFDLGNRLGNKLVSPENRMPPDIGMDIGATAGVHGVGKLLSAGGIKPGIASTLFSMLGGATLGVGAVQALRDPKVDQSPVPKMDDNRDGFSALLNELQQEEEKDDATLPVQNPNFPSEMRYF